MSGEEGLIAGLVLAAGESSRMGRDKALLDYNGRTFLEAIIACLREGGVDQIAVVLGHHAGEICAAAKLDGARLATNPDYRLGQTTSLQTGLRALAPLNPAAILLCLVDHPAISHQTVRTLCESFRETHAPVAVPVYQGRRGHPVIIACELFGGLLKLPPDQGANQLIRAREAETMRVDVDDPGVLLDIDVPADYAALSVRHCRARLAACLKLTGTG